MCLDSNIFQSFDKVGLLDLLIKFLNDDEIDAMVPEDVFFESHRKIREKLEPCITKKKVDKPFVKEIKNDITRIHKHIHTRKDKDYQIIALSVKEKVNYLITNDRDILTATKKYKNYKGFKKDEIILTSLAGLIRFMYICNKTLFRNEIDIAEKNFLFCSNVELPNCYDGIKNREWELKMVINSVNPYHSNVLEIIGK